jgi:hypothetical protein
MLTKSMKRAGSDPHPNFFVGLPSFASVASKQDPDDRWLHRKTAP